MFENKQRERERDLSEEQEIRKQKDSQSGVLNMEVNMFPCIYTGGETSSIKVGTFQRYQARLSQQTTSEYSVFYQFQYILYVKEIMSYK